MLFTFKTIGDLRKACYESKDYKPCYKVPGPNALETLSSFSYNVFYLIKGLKFI